MTPCGSSQWRRNWSRLMSARRRIMLMAAIMVVPASVGSAASSTLRKRRVYILSPSLHGYDCREFAMPDDAVTTLNHWKGDHAGVPLLDLRYTVSRVRRSARGVSRLRGRTAVCAGVGTILDYAGEAAQHAQQQIPPPCRGADDHRDDAGVRHRAARLPGAHAGWQRAVGVHRARRRRHHRRYQGAWRCDRDRDFAPALLYDHCGMEPRAR